MSFDGKDTFYLDGEPFQIISGAIHYFRVVPEYWRDRLEKLKAMGCNTVETYIPWNLHEPRKGQFRFEGILDVARFVRIAQELGLYVILRPSPYICAEWDLGGLPAWLLAEDGIKFRCACPSFLAHVEDYYRTLLPILAPLSQFAGIGGELIVTAFQSASGLVNIVTPTAAVVMGGLALGDVPFDRWIRFVWKLILIFFALTIGFLAVSAIL